MGAGLSLGQVMNAIIPSDRVVVINAAGQVIYRGFAAGMETYRKTERLYDWQNIRELPQTIPVEQLEEFSTKELNHIIYTRIILRN